MPRKPDLDQIPPIPVGVYATGWIDIALAQGFEPLKTIHLHVRQGHEVKRLQGVIGEQRKNLDNLGFSGSATSVTAAVSSVVCSKTPATDRDGQEIAYPWCPAPDAKPMCVAAQGTTPEKLKDTYMVLKAACKDYVDLGTRVEALLRQVGEIPDELDTFRVQSVAGVLGWKLHCFPGPRTLAFDYYTYRSPDAQ
jgi:hypothetical protein